jgi:lipopolysaccharide transport system permease protein
VPKVSALSSSQAYEDADAVIRRVRAANASGRSMLYEAKELWKYRALLISMVRREMRIRYKSSVLGFLWSFINPLVTVLVLTFVFKYIYANTTPNFSAYVLASYLPFMFFQMAVMDSAQSVLGNLTLIKKVYFPREILPLSQVLANFIHLLLAFVMFFAYLAVIYIRDPRSLPFQPYTLFLPVLLLINLCLVTGLSLLVSAWNVFYEDVKYVVSIVLYLMFFMCPVMYEIERVYYRFQHMNPTVGRLLYDAYIMNPEAMIVIAYRKILLAPQPYIHDDSVTKNGVTTMKHMVEAPVPLSGKGLIVAALLSVFILIYGYRTFNRMKWRFVERV